MAAKRVRRVELRLGADDPVTRGLEREAAGRGVSLAEHIADLLKARALGPSWGAPIASPPSEADPPGDAAAALADEWM